MQLHVSSASGLTKTNWKLDLRLITLANETYQLPLAMIAQYQWTHILTVNALFSGVIDFLISNHPIAKTLRDHIVFKIVPMLNPDGVYLGNYRYYIVTTV